MSLPTQRITITATEYQLLKPGLSVLSCGLAEAQRGLFPHRHPWHRLDTIASDVYANQRFDQEMAERIISLYARLLDISQSRKIRLDVLNVALLQFALRLARFGRPDASKPASMPLVQTFHSKLERYRQRAKRAAISKVGKAAYKDSQQRWQDFVAWCRYNLLQFKLPKRGAPYRAKLWRDQREQRASAVKQALERRHFEFPVGQRLTRILALLVRSLRRGRYSRTLAQVLEAPEKHVDFLVSFIQKRLDLARTPGAPLSHWEAYWERAEVFAAYKNRLQNRSTVDDRATVGDMRSASNSEVQASIPTPLSNQVSATDVELQEVLANWFLTEVDWNFARRVMEQIQFLIKSNLHLQHRRPASGTSIQDADSRNATDGAPNVR